MLNGYTITYTDSFSDEVRVKTFIETSMHNALNKLYSTSAVTEETIHSCVRNTTSPRELAKEYGRSNSPFEYEEWVKFLEAQALELMCHKVERESDTYLSTHEIRLEAQRRLR